jgi:hypothetical protein
MTHSTSKALNMVMINVVKLNMVDKGQSVKTLHAPDCGSAPFFTAVLIACLMWAPTSLANDKYPPELSASPGMLGLTKVGEGRMKWFGFSLYKASLWTQDGVYLGMPVTPRAKRDAMFSSATSDAAGYHPYSLPVALHIVYEKNISRETLIVTTLKEWRRLKIFNAVQHRQWVKLLRHIWPDVEPGDSITTVVQDNGHTRFLVNGREGGTVTDPRFGPALLAIWLHPQTRAAQLRAHLLGLQGG